MTIEKHHRKLLVIIAEASIEKQLVDLVIQLGAHGYTVADVRGRGASGVREGIWEVDRTIRMEILCESTVADTIASEVMAKYAANFGLSLYFSDVDVLRPEKY